MNGYREDPASVAKWFREDAGLSQVDRIKPRDISNRHELVVQEVELDGLGYCGVAMVQKGIPGILINKNQYPPRYRFTYAHEMGHIFLARHYEILVDGKPFFDQKISQTDPANELEAEANKFAAELLAPADRVRLRLRTGDLDMAAACDLEETFGLSLTAAAVRVVDVSPQQVAVLRFNGNRLYWKYDGRDFPYGVPWWSGWEAPAGSATVDAIDGKGNQREAVEVAPQTWFVERDRGRYPPQLLESCIRLGNTGGFLTMLWAP